ncbi:MAG: molybdopterin-dependent oxidoreductase [Pseudomonadota bacterium]
MTIASHGDAVRTACPYCGVGCGVLATPDGRGGASIAGDPSHPANQGRLCSKGSALGETLDLEGRLLAPRIGGREAHWDEAIKLVAERFRAAITQHGPDSVAFYVSGQLLTEDYYVANKLMKGFIGSANIDTNSRLCMASTVAGHRRAFGGDLVPGTYEDLELADLVVLTGSNLAWCHPVLFQRLAAARAARPEMRVVVIDPRRTATTELADLHLALRPGADVALFNWLLGRIEVEGAVDTDFVTRHVADMPAALAAAREDTLERTALTTGLHPSDLRAFVRLFLGTERVVTVFSQGVNQSTAGTDKVNAIINCHLATGRIGRPGMGPFSVTGQPNAMGGREVGGLANMLAAHLAIENPEHRAAVQSFWRSPRICARPGLKAVDLFEACADGRIKALWIMSTNPAVSMPRAGDVTEAIRACDFVAVSDAVADTDTTRLANVLLPAAAWGEKSGTVTNSDRVISRQRPFLPPPGRARPDWRIICDVAAAMGWRTAFDYAQPAEIFREHATLSGIAAQRGAAFDISAFADLSDAAYEELSPTRWPVPRDGAPRERLFADGAFRHVDGRARMLPVHHRPPAVATSADFPLILNTGRVRDHWHTMTRTAKSARLSRHLAEPYAEIHPEDAAAAGITAASLAEVTSPFGSLTVRALVTDRTPRGSIFVPMHWTSLWARKALVDSIVGAETDPHSGQPESKAQPVRIAPFRPDWYGFAVSRSVLEPRTAYWARARIAGGWQAEIADQGIPEDWSATARALLALPCDAEVMELADPSRGGYRLAAIREGRVTAAFFASRDPVAVSRSFVTGALSADEASAPSPGVVLAGRPGRDMPDPGATVCACFDVGVNTIVDAILREGLSDVASIGEALGAGTNCGSCRPELASLLAANRAPVAAE